MLDATLSRGGQCTALRSSKIASRPAHGSRMRCAAGGNGRRSTTFHKLIEEKGIVLLPGVYDALSAKILHSTGHNVAFVSGYAVSATLLGEPDLGLLTPPEMARKASQICYAVPTLHVIADADTGGGNVLNVQRTVKQLIGAGCKGIFLEDQQWPKRAGHMRNKEVIGMEDFAAKVAAAREVIGDADFFLVARTDARGTSAKYGMEDAITRANLYHDAGADATFVEAPRSTEELREIGEKTKGLKVCNMLEGGVTPLHSPQELKDLGFSMVVHPLSGLYAVKRALQQVYTTLGSEGTTRGSLDSMADLAEFNELVGYEEKIRFEEHLTHPSGEKLVVRVRAGVKAAEI